MIDRSRILQEIQRNVLIYHTKSAPLPVAMHALQMLHPLDSGRANC